MSERLRPLRKGRVAVFATFILAIGRLEILEVFNNAIVENRPLAKLYLQVDSIAKFRGYLFLGVQNS